MTSSSCLCADIRVETSIHIRTSIKHNSGHLVRNVNKEHLHLSSGELVNNHLTFTFDARVYLPLDFII